jgi:hypothetical protein
MQQIMSDKQSSAAAWPSTQPNSEAETDTTTLLLTLNRAYQEVLQDKIDDIRRLLAQNKRQQVRP